MKKLYDHVPFTLKLPSLDNLLWALQSLGSEARLFKIHILRALRHVPIDPADVIHLDIKLNDKFYIDKNSASGAVHGTALFQRISNFVRFILGKRGFQVWNYIDDIYACYHKDHADKAFQSLQQVIQDIGLPVNPKKVFSPSDSLSILGIIVDVPYDTFCIEDEKLGGILQLCEISILKDTKQDLHKLLGKLLYISRC